LSAVARLFHGPGKPTFWFNYPNAAVEHLLIHGGPANSGIDVKVGRPPESTLIVVEENDAH
jgi:hypothetical protein